MPARDRQNAPTFAAVAKPIATLVAADRRAAHDAARAGSRISLERRALGARLALQRPRRRRATFVYVAATGVTCQRCRVGVRCRFVRGGTRTRDAREAGARQRRAGAEARRGRGSARATSGLTATPSCRTSLAWCWRCRSPIACRSSWPIARAERRAPCMPGGEERVRGVAPAAVARLTSEFGVRPGDVIAAIGPSIGPDDYEVGESLVDAFRHAGHSPERPRAMVHPPRIATASRYVVGQSRSARGRGRLSRSHLHLPIEHARASGGVRFVSRGRRARRDGWRALFACPPCKLKVESWQLKVSVHSFSFKFSELGTWN